MLPSDRPASIVGAMSQGIDIRNVPDNIRAAIEADAADRDVSRNACVVSILCARYGLTCDESGARNQGSSSDHWFIRVPDVLYSVIRSHAREVGGTLPGVVLLALAQHFDLPAVSPRKRMRRSLNDEQVAEVRRRVTAREISQRAIAQELGVTRKVIAAAVNG